MKPLKKTKLNKADILNILLNYKRTTLLIFPLLLLVSVIVGVQACNQETRSAKASSTNTKPYPDSYYSTNDSPFVKGLKPDQHESLLYIWTRDGDGKDSDFLAVVDVDPESETYGQIIATEPTGSASNETHHFGYTRSTGRIIGAGLFTNKLFIYDVETDPRDPRLIKMVDLHATGYSGPHTIYAVPAGIIIPMLGAAHGGGGPAGVIKLDDDGNFIEAYSIEGGEDAPVYTYDVDVKPSMNRMVTSAWAHPHFVKMQGGSPAKHTGNKVVVWNWETKEILQVVKLDKAPLSVRWMHGPEARGGFIPCAYGSTIWYFEDTDNDGEIEFHRVIKLKAGSAPADVQISMDNRYLYLSLFAGGEVRQYDISDPMQPKLVDAIQVPHPNMVQLSPDSERLYVTNSLLSTMDPDQNFHAWLVHVGPDGMTMDSDFDPDFSSFPTGPAGPHDMLLK